VRHCHPPEVAELYRSEPIINLKVRLTEPRPTGDGPRVSRLLLRPLENRDTEEPMNPALSYIYARLSEPSTWRGIIALVTAAGVALSPDRVDKIVAAGLALIGLIGAFTPDKMKAAILMLIVLPGISGTASAQTPILPWRAQIHHRLQQVENKAAPAPIQAPAPQPIHIYLPSQPANPPLQTFAVVPLRHSASWPAGHGLPEPGPSEPPSS
jgi:hypothetical protein